MHTTREVSLLNDGIKGMLPNLGTSIASGLGNEMGNMIGSLPPQTLATLGQLGLSPEALSQLTQPAMQDISASGNALGQEIVDAFRTDTRNIWAGSVMLTQPIFMGGGIIALNKMADIGEDLMRNQSDMQLQSIRLTGKWWRSGIRRSWPKPTLNW